VPGNGKVELRSSPRSVARRWQEAIQCGWRSDVVEIYSLSKSRHTNQVGQFLVQPPSSDPPQGGEETD
jgi:hypothetical protein